MQIGSVLLLLGIGGALAGGGEEGEKVASVPPSTTSGASASTTARPATTKAGPTTTATLSKEGQILAHQLVFDANRQKLADAIKSDFGPSTIQSVDKLTFDTSGPAVVLDATSSFRTTEFLDNAAWNVTRGLAVLWSPKSFGIYPQSVPSLRMTLNSRNYGCPADFMVKLANTQASRADWDQSCG